jgi:hypothetical protein
MNKDQLTFHYQHQVLEDANKAVHAGAELSLAEATIVLEVIRSKQCKKGPDGNHHYYTDDVNPAIGAADVVIPEAVELSAIKVVRDASHATPSLNVSDE